jgi:DNA-binding NtrC family response regulator
VAQAIHQMSPRAKNPFVVVHCASLNPNLLESELFGHEKGAFTSAVERQIGRFEKADGGTLFLDEVGELDASTQIKLLRVLETRTFERVGGTSSIEVDVRLLAATNRNLRKMVEEGGFREDLYYRLNVVNIELPPLRKRDGDVPLLLEHFLRIFTEENGRKINGFSREAMNILTSYHWPGNVRELRNCVERMVVMARGTTLTLGDVPSDIRKAAAHPELSAAGDSLDINSQERELIIRALRECNGNRSQAAEKLGISRRTLYRKLDSYGI